MKVSDMLLSLFNKVKCISLAEIEPIFTCTFFGTTTGRRQVELLCMCESRKSMI